MKELISSIETFVTDSPEMDETKQRFLQFIEENKDCLLRSNLKGHLTASAFVVDFNANKILLLHHKKLEKWLQPGGHCDGDCNTLHVAIKEVFEETGIKIFPKNQEIVDLDIHPIPGKNLVPEHNHFDIRYLFLADSNIPLVKNHESIALQWVELDALHEFTKEESLLRFSRKFSHYKNLNKYSL